jgi:hypothetical protein
LLTQAKRETDLKKRLLVSSYHFKIGAAKRIVVMVGLFVCWLVVVMFVVFEWHRQAKDEERGDNNNIEVLLLYNVSMMLPLN